VTVPASSGTMVVSPQLLTVPNTAGTVMVSGNMPAFSAYLASQQNISNNSWTKVTINTKQFDTNNNFDAGTNYRFTPTVAGYYQINGSIEFNSTSTNPTVVGVRIYKNGNPFFGDFSTGSANSGQTTNISCLISMNGSTDYIELYGFANNAAGTPYFQASTSGNSISTYFSGCLLRSI
jgi:hypothetical protein